MSLTKFVNNVEDLSDDAGFKFRFKCDRCGDGFESQYTGSKMNVLKTAMDVFQVFSPFGGRMTGAANDIDRGLRGKERDAAYERAVGEAMAFFKKCSACGHWVCPENCWNDKSGMCDDCAPEAAQAGAKETNRLAGESAVKAATEGKATPVINCPVCGAQAKGVKFCESCGANLQPTQKCKSCNAVIEAGAKFCGECGAKA